MIIIKAEEVRAGDYITVPGVTIDRPVLVEHAWLDHDVLDMVQVTIWPMPSLKGEDERTRMVTLSLNLGTQVAKFKPDEGQMVRIGQGTAGVVESVIEGRASATGSISRTVRFVDRRQYVTAVNSASTYDAANLHGGDYAYLDLDRLGRIIKIQHF